MCSRAGNALLVESLPVLNSIAHSPEDAAPSAVIVIGWAGASPSQLEPVVDWHRAQGAAVLQLLPALSGETDADCLDAMHAFAARHSVRCCLHCFSNNAVFFLRRILSQADPDAPRWPPLHGLILDSGEGLVLLCHSMPCLLTRRRCAQRRTPAWTRQR